MICSSWVDSGFTVSYRGSTLYLLRKVPFSDIILDYLIYYFKLIPLARKFDTMIIGYAICTAFMLIAIIKYKILPILDKVTERDPEYSEVVRLKKFLLYFNSVSDKEIPPTSLLREFMGGSSFEY